MTVAHQSQVAAERGDKKTVSHVLGEVTWLMGQSAVHKHMFVADLEWMVMPAILLEQFRIFYGPEQRPAGVIIWAAISDEADQRLAAGNIRLSPPEWKGGTNLWIVEMIAPFGGQEEMIADAAQSVFGGKSFKFHKTAASGVEVVTYPGEAGR